jgi:hypothetical protein
MTCWRTGECSGRQCFSRFGVFSFCQNLPKVEKSPFPEGLGLQESVLCTLRNIFIFPRVEWKKRATADQLFAERILVPIRGKNVRRPVKI